MFSKKSIRNKFALQLVLASAALIVIFSTILYNYVKISVYEDLNVELTKDATKIATEYSRNLGVTGITFFKHATDKNNNDFKIVVRAEKKHKINFEQYKRNGASFLTIYYPFDKKKSTFLSLTKNISNTDKLLNKILRSIIVINFITIFLIIFYALLLSRMLIIPIHSLTTKLAAMDENFFQSINTKNIPDEFEPLAISINKLVDRIHTFVKYQKELFTGTAHELKTPLAVMKTKNEVTLLKKRDEQRYIATLRENNKTIDEMNKMIGCILEIGRLEGAQFEQPIEMDLIQFLKERTNNFKILAHQDKKTIIKNFLPRSFPIMIQPTLLIHILQNFVQNAIKFTADGGKIEIKSFTDSDGINIHVIDEGIGIDESQDLFAPFKRYGGKEGAGLGLFLAKRAADAIGATITIKNRKDANGAVATLHIPISNKKLAKNAKKCDI
ncbi:MAG TPA: HAMP domain-containing histidine kinase [Sulfurospirillum arcachonense]|nr:HAMP domain-containing histidine kinase [Sulfurospirillum arcachonense]HIP43739.1 HAMP domain-containing histidine kinase [Sulfurospirillum arcachonense]